MENKIQIGTVVYLKAEARLSLLPQLSDRMRKLSAFLKMEKP